MKKLLFLSIIAFFALVSANVFGASTPTQPNAGATHKYWVNGDGTTNTHITSSYTWEVLRAGGTAAAPADYTLVPVTGLPNVVNITWNASAVALGGSYFLVLTETADGCINKKAMEITPINAFAVTASNVNKDASAQGWVDIANNNQLCAPDVALTLAPSAIVYNYGTTTLYYRIGATGLASNWSFDYKFAETGKDANSVISAYWAESFDAQTNNLTYSTTGGSISTIAGAKDLFFKVVVNNGTTATPATAAEGLAAHLITLTVSNFKDAANNIPLTINSTSITSTTNTNDLLQTVKARPNTSGISAQ